MKHFIENVEVHEGNTNNTRWIIYKITSRGVSVNRWTAWKEDKTMWRKQRHGMKMYSLLELEWRNG